jgi:hypothetical protein
MAIMDVDLRNGRALTLDQLRRFIRYMHYDDLEKFVASIEEVRSAASLRPSSRKLTVRHLIDAVTMPVYPPPDGPPLAPVVHKVGKPASV